MYTPSDKILEKYANVLVNFALGSGKGIKPGEVVFIQVPEVAKPILIHLRRAVLKSGGFPIIEYLPDDISKDYYLNASDKQLDFFPASYMRGKVDQMDHVVSIIADTNLEELKGIDPTKIMRKAQAFKPYKDWRFEKENKGKMTWTLALYTTPAMAKEAKMTEKEYWEQIIKGCYLDEKDPVVAWNKSFKEIERLRRTLNKLKIESLHIEAPGTDLTIGLGKNRTWLGGTGRNIPSFEVFISPDYRLTEGTIAFNEPLYHYGNTVRDITLTFKGGKVVKSTAKTGQKVLTEMIKAEGADLVGEYSLTDSRLSRITKFMATTLFDENVGGKNGNTHLALGSAYQESYPGNLANVKPAEWKKMGYNDSVVHTDIVATTNRVVTATLPNGKTKVIYKDGKFTV